MPLPKTQPILMDTQQAKALPPASRRTTTPAPPPEEDYIYSSETPLDSVFDEETPEAPEEELEELDELSPLEDEEDAEAEGDMGMLSWDEEEEK
jgi:hypothetical protein